MDKCIGESRVPVWVYINYCRLGGTREKFLRDYPQISKVDLWEAERYALKNQKKVQKDIRENEEGQEYP